MPEAIATTKRKFYKALDALTASSQTSLHHAASETPSTSSTKRSSATAFEEARERVRKRLRQSTSSSSLTARDNGASVISLPAQSAATNSTASQSPPNYSPWSQEAFLARLKTFSSVSLWHPKPEVINEVEWAKRGWVCVDVNTVACKGGCGNRVVVSLGATKDKTRALEADAGGEDEEQDQDDEERAASLENALAERYRSVLAEGHSPPCLWRKAGCKDDIYRLPVVRPSVWQPQLRRRLQSLLELEDSIRRIKTRELDSLDSQLLYELPQDILGLAMSPDSSAERPFQIAMHGWRGSSEAGNQLLHCDTCFQRVGLWMYQPEYQKPGSDTVEDVDADPAIIDLVEMHRDHCPWRNAESQKATGSLAGLSAIQILHKVVATAAKDHRRRSNPQPTQADVEPDQDDAIAAPILSREETARQDKERESRLRRIKNLFNLKRRPTVKSSVQKAA